MKPTISLIIPAHNEEKYILNTLQSIEEQTEKGYEVIVIANGCTDKTEALVKKKAGEKLRLLSLPKANVSVARNAGALNAKGELLLFLDADTQLEKDALKTMQENFTTEHSVATTKAKPDSPKLKYRAALWLKNRYIQMGFYDGCSGALLCRKKEFHETQGYEPAIIVKEHRKLILKLKQRGKFTCLPTTVTTSMRRFEQWGLLKAAAFWIEQWIRNSVGDLRKSEYEKIR